MQSDVILDVKKEKFENIELIEKGQKEPNQLNTATDQLVALEEMNENQSNSQTRYKFVHLAVIAVILCSLMAVLLYLIIGSQIDLSKDKDQIYVSILLTVVSFIASSLSIGYGTAMAAILMILGFETTGITASILFSESFSSIISAILHYRVGNLNMDRKSISIMLVLSSCAIIGVIISQLTRLNISSFAVGLYIGIMILCLGFFVLLTKLKKELLGTQFHWWKLIVFGTIAAFNKGISGGGFGPIICGGQIVSGVNERAAIAITSTAEVTVSVAGTIAYVITSGWMDWYLAIPLTIGSILSVPVSVFAVKHLRTLTLGLFIGLLCICFGILYIVKVSLRG